VSIDTINRCFDLKGENSCQTFEITDTDCVWSGSVCRNKVCGDVTDMEECDDL
jgi:hypothetical protein